MKKIRCLVSAGPTREYFDPVRYISNPSSGKMGYAIAETARDAGWDVTLVSGPCFLKVPKDVRFVSVTSAQDMLEACKKYFIESDILIMSAAVSDVRPAEKSSRKLKKSEIDLNPRLERTPDILLTLSKEKKKQILVGFAAETENVREYALKKLEQKNLDCIVANCVSGEKSAFASDENDIDMIMRSGEIIDFKPASKIILASRIIEFLSVRFFGANAKPKSKI